MTHSVRDTSSGRDPSLRVEQSSEPFAASAPAGDGGERATAADIARVLQPRLFGIGAVGPATTAERNRLIADGERLLKTFTVYARPPAVEVREALTEDDVMKIITRNFGGKMWESLTRTDWKDGIDIQRPSYAVMHFARDLAALSASPREMVQESDGGVEPHELEDLIMDRSASRAADAILREFVVTRKSGIKPGPSEPSPDYRCDYCKEHGFQHPNLCEDCLHKASPPSSTSEPSPSSRSETAWQPIETAPKDGVDVLLYFPLDGLSSDWPKTIIGHWRKGAYECDHWVWQSRAYRGYSDEYQPTHWQPLPLPPSPDCSGCKPTEGGTGGAK